MRFRRYLPEISGDEIGLLRSCTPLLYMTAYTVDLSSLGFISPPMWTDSALQQKANVVNHCPVCSFRCKGWYDPLALYSLLIFLDGSVDDSFRMFLPHDVLFLDVILVQGRI